MRLKSREERVADFREFAKKGNFKTDPEDVNSVWNCFKEEVEELVYAGVDYDDTPSEENRADFVKELADVQYVLSQLAVFYCVELEDAFSRVHESNLTKVVDGEIKKRADGKILKPETYVAPSMRGL